MKKLPIGIDRFEKLRRLGCYYVDKTGLIKELLDEACEVSLFTRPRRFGKSLNLDMLKNFFEKGADRNLFEGLEILNSKDLCAEHFGAYPVVYLNFKDVDGDCFETAYQALCSAAFMEVRRQCLKYALLQSSVLLETDQLFLKDVLAGSQDSKAIQGLCRVPQYLFEHCKKKVILLLDEYDVPLDKAYQKGYYDKMLDVICGLLSMLLKSNEHLQFAVLTGCLQIARESIFTGLNHFVVNSVSDEEYSAYFGFTEAEVQQMLTYYGLDGHLNTVREWYNGYHFGAAPVYCPWDVLNYLRKLRRNPNAMPESFWVNSSSNAILQKLLAEATETVKEQLELLISGEVIEKKLVPALTYKDLDHPDALIRETYLWSVMYAAGYLTQTERLSGGVSRLKIPNREILEIYNEKISAWFRESVRGDTDRLTTLCQAFIQGEAAKVQAVFNDCLSGCISIRDTYARKEMKENFYHGMLLGILQCEGSWSVKSNQESGTGYGDIVLASPKDKIGCIIEMKYAENGAFEKYCKMAMRQIECQNYADYFLQKNMNEVHMYGIACYKKECVVMHQRINYLFD